MKNKHGALYEVTKVEFDGAVAEVIDGGRSGGAGLIVWLDFRDFHPCGLEVVRDA